MPAGPLSAYPKEVARAPFAEILLSNPWQAQRPYQGSTLSPASRESQPANVRPVGHDGSAILDARTLA